MTEETAADLAGNYTRHKFAAELYESTYTPDGPRCQNCGETVERVTLVPEYEYMGCDACMEEALKALATEEVRRRVAIAAREFVDMVAESGCTPEEVTAFVAFAKPARIARQQGEINFGEVA